MQKLNLRQLSLISGLFFLVFMMGADSFIIAPILPTLQVSFHGSLAQTALAVTVYAISYAVGSPLLGPLGDCFSRKRLLLVGTLIFAAGCGGCLVATRLWWFIGARALTGIGAAISLPNVWAIIGSVFKGNQLATVMGVTMAALSLSIAIGVPLGTWCTQVMSWRVIFGFSVGLAAGLAGLLWLVVPVDVTTKGQPTSSAWVKVFGRTSNVGLALSVTLLWMFGFYLIYTFLGTFLAQQFKFSPAQVGLVFTIYGGSNFVASWFSGRFTTRMGALSNVIWSAGGSALIGLILALVASKLVGLIVLIIGLAIIQGLGVPAISTYLVTLQPVYRTTIMAFNSAAIYLGLTLSSLIGSYGYPRIGFSGLCLLTAGCFGGVVVLGSYLKLTKIE